jgi:putative ABC transport system substrate-binding protein
MKRRNFISLLGCATAWPLATRAQLPRERMRRIGVLTPFTVNDPEVKNRFEALAASLRQLGWSDGENLRIEVLWGGGAAERMRRDAAELVALAPDVIVTTGSATTAAALQETRTIPIVFVQVADAVGGGYVESLPRPGGNATGFTVFEYGISGKWLELLKEIAPRVTQVAILRDTTIAAGAGQFGAIQSIAPSFGVELRPISLLDVAEIERAITAFARIPNGGLIAVAGSGTAIHRRLIIKLAAEFRLPAVYPYRYYANEGGLISYGPDNIDLYRRAASYVDRILRGEKPADLPVQTPTKYELVINLKTAKALGIEVPPMLLARADEVIE